MNILSEIQQRLVIPAQFGIDLPYVRFSRVQDENVAGEDITLEFQYEAGDANDARIVFSHSEWMNAEGRTRTSPLCTAVICSSSGEAIGETPSQIDQAVEGIRRALTHADQLMRVK